MQEAGWCALLILVEGKQSQADLGSLASQPSLCVELYTHRETLSQASKQPKTTVDGLINNTQG